MNASNIVGDSSTPTSKPTNATSILDLDFSKLVSDGKASNDLTGTDEYKLPTSDLADSDSVQDIF